MAEYVDLSPITRAIGNLESNLSSRIDGVGTEVGQVRGDLRLASDELRQLKADFEEFTQTAARVANVQRSETKVAALRADLDRQFGHYTKVRLTSVGILQSFDVGNVSNDTVSSVSEELMIQTPRYWLAPALVALAAWSKDDPEMAEKSVQETFSRDKNKASLFFALVLRRQGRIESSVRWLRHYLLTLDPSSLTREFAVILEAASYDAFGTTGRDVVSELRDRKDIVEAQVEQWASEIGVQRMQFSAGGEYAALAHLTPEWKTLEFQLEMASALPATIEKYDAIAKHDASIPSFLEDLLDDILDQLVTEYDEEELPLKREVVFHDAVIEEDGDLTRARERADELNKALEETSDVVSMQTQAAINPDTLGVSTQTQRIAIGVGQEDFRVAVGRYCVYYRSSAVDEVSLSFTGDHSNYAQTYSFQGCTIETSEQEDAGVARLAATWQSTFAEYIKTISFKNSWYVAPAMIGFLVGLIGGAILGAVIGFPIIGILLGWIAAGGALFFLGQQKRQKCDDAVAAAWRQQEAAVEHSVSMYRDAMAQFVDLQLTYGELDSNEDGLLQIIDTWPTATRTKKMVA